MSKLNPMRALAALLVITALALGSSAYAQFGVSITIAPPPLPVYEQPVIPEPGYMWTPGYWAYGPDGYFWVPGTWIQPPTFGLLWTPGYWGWSGGAFLWNEGYWGPQIGFYGGVNYGYGYGGVGYQGGYWQGNRFFYNSTVNNIHNVQITNVYNKTVINNTTINNVSYNGGSGGLTMRPTAAEEAAARAPHQSPTSMQTQQRTAASSNHDLLATVNHGKPPIAATSKPNVFSGAGVVKATRTGAPGGGDVKIAAPPARAPVHASDLPKASPPPAIKSGNDAQDQEYQRQQSALQAKQEQERQDLVRKQAADHARAAQNAANAESVAKLEQQHQQQTQQLQARHTAEQQKLQQSAARPAAPQAAPHEAPHEAPRP
jgi:hypothetical protein